MRGRKTDRRLGPDRGAANADSGDGALVRPRAAIVIGGAASVFADVEAFAKIGKHDAVIACNDIGAHWDGPLRAWVTLHKDKMPTWLAARQKAGLPDPEDIVFHEEGAGQNGIWRVEPSKVLWHMWPEMAFSGSSGLFGVKAALEAFGYDRVVLCGVPMSPGPHFQNGPWDAHECSLYQQAWRDVLPRLNGTVKSMGGLTRELLGAPSIEWLNGQET